jgi:NAD(P)-dependent dehydrogenase (short-subunit alcohol dehydrogenase family)
MATGTFSGRVGLVTGAGSGIGAGTAKRFAAAGATVALIDIDEIAGEAVLAEIEDAGGTARFFHCDVTDAVQVESTIDGIVGAFDHLDFAFNNAGITGPMCPTADVTIDAWKQVIDLDLSGVFYCMKYEIPHMIAGGGGAIVNTSSDAGLHSIPTIAPYVAAKHAVVGLTKATAQEYAAFGVRVNCICPGVTDTPMMELWYTAHPESRASATRSIPIGRGGTVDEVANAVMWLCSDEATYAVGMIMALDGGLTLGLYGSF